MRAGDVMTADVVTVSREARVTYQTVAVIDGVVHLWGTARSNAERAAPRVAAETVPGVRGVEDHLMDYRAWSSAE